MLDKIRSLFSSRRFLAALAAVTVVILRDHIGLTEEMAMQITGIVMAWILGDAYRETK